MKIKIKIPISKGLQYAAGRDYLRLIFTQGFQGDIWDGYLFCHCHFILDSRIIRFSRAAISLNMSCDLRDFRSFSPSRSFQAHCFKLHHKYECKTTFFFCSACFRTGNSSRLSEIFFDRLVKSSASQFSGSKSVRAYEDRLQCSRPIFKQWRV